MNGPQLCLSGFAAHATPRMRFCNSPHLSIQKAFHEIARGLPPQGSVIFHHSPEGISADIYPYCGRDAALDNFKPEPTHLAYRLYPQHGSAVITRIKAEASRHGLGSAMIASQYPFLQGRGVRYLSVITHESAQGFYDKLGFAQVDHLPEKPTIDGKIYTLMRLDLQQQAQRSRFEAALGKVRPLLG